MPQHQRQGAEQGGEGVDLLVQHHRRLGRQNVAADAAAVAKSEAKPRQMDAAARNLLYKSIKDATDESTGWAFVGKIGNVISETRPDFDSRSYGYAKLSGMLRDLRGLQFRTDEANHMYCRKIPFGDLVKLLDEAFSKFKSAKGWASMDVMGKYVKPRWNWEEYGFENFPDLLNKVDHVEIANDSMRMQAGTSSQS